MKQLLIVVIGLFYAIFASANCDGGHVQISFKNDKPYSVIVTIDGQGRVYVNSQLIVANYEKEFCLPLESSGIYQIHLTPQNAGPATELTFSRQFFMGLGVLSISANSIISQ